jgi:hypothetical protein
VRAGITAAAIDQPHAMQKRWTHRQVIWAFVASFERERDQAQRRKPLFASLEVPPSVTGPPGISGSKEEGIKTGYRPCQPLKNLYMTIRRRHFWLQPGEPVKVNHLA